MCSGSFDEKASGASSLESPLSPTPVVRLLNIHKLGLTQESLSSNFGNNKAGLQIYGGPGSLSNDFKIWPITFQGSGPILVKKSHFNNRYSSYNKSTNSTKQKVLVGSQYSKTCPKQLHKILITNGTLMKVKIITECSLLPLEHSAIILTCIKR